MFRGQQPAGPARIGETQCRVVSARCLMSLSGHFLRPEGIDSPIPFHKIHCGGVSIEKDKYLTPAHSLKSTISQCPILRIPDHSCLEELFSRTIPQWNIGKVFLLRWSFPRPPLLN